jgi:hypothetical protein
MISPLAPANAGRLSAQVFSGARGIGALLRAIGSEIGRLGWLTRVGCHGRWVGLRPEVARGAVWGLALQWATEAVDAPEPDAASARRRRAKTPPTAPPVTPTKRARRVVPGEEGGASAGAASARLPRSLAARLRDDRLAAIAGGVPAMAALHEAATRRIPWPKPDSACTAPPVAPVLLSPKRSERMWWGDVSTRVLRSLGLHSEQHPSMKPDAWSMPLTGEGCHLDLLEASVASATGAADRSHARTKTGHDVERRPGKVSSAHGLEVAQPVLSETDPPRRKAEQMARDPAVDAFRAAAAPTSGQQESDTLYQELLEGGPASSAAPPRVTPEPDIRNDAAPPAVAGQAGPTAGTVSRFQAPARYTDQPVPAPAGASPEHIATVLAQVLCDEARRHGIDV